MLWTWAVGYRRFISRWTSRRPFVTLFGAGALSAVAMAPFHFWPILFLTLPALFWALDSVGDDGWSHATSRSQDDATDQTAAGAVPLSKQLRAAAFRGWAFGFGYHFAGLYWIGYSFLVQAERFAAVMPFTIASLTAALGLFFAFAGLAYAFLNRHIIDAIARLCLLALAIMVAEWLRGHILTGFPWNILGYALTMPLPLMQWAGVFGIYGLTAITVLTLTAPLVLATAPQTRAYRATAIAALTVAPLSCAFAYGAWQLSQHPTELLQDVRLRLVQPGFSQKDKFDQTKYGEMFRRQLQMSHEGAWQGQNSAAGPVLPTHVLWPEAAIPFLVRRNASALASIDRALPDDMQIITGGFRIDVPPQVPTAQISKYQLFNSALVIGGNGQVTSIYDKIHLVPFGEYLPAQDLLEAFGFENLTRTSGGLAIGKSPRQLMQIEGLPPASMLICYEASFPNEVIQTSERPGVLINLTNDAWFGTSTGPYQHLHQTRVRAVEQGLPVLRSANTGVSAIVDPVGRITKQLGLNDVGVLDAHLPKPSTPGIYAQNQLLVEFGILILLVGATLTGTQRHIWSL